MHMQISNQCQYYQLTKNYNTPNKDYNQIIIRSKQAQFYFKNRMQELQPNVNGQQTQEDPTNYFCYLYIGIVSTASIGFIVIILQTAIMIYAIKQYLKTKQLSMLSRNLKLIYATLLIQCIRISIVLQVLPVFLAKLILSQVIYWFPRPAGESDADRYQFYSTASKYIFVIDIVGVFSIQAMLMLVCFNWMDKIIQIFSELSNLQDTTQSKKQKTISFLKFQVIIKKTLRFYLNARFVFFGLVIAFIAVNDHAPQSILYRIMLALLVVELVIVPIILGLGIAAIRKNTRLQELVGEKETSQMVRQYSILLVSTLFRFVLDLIFVIEYYIKIGQSTQCTIKKQEYSFDLFVTIISFCLETTITHCLPVFVVLSIFKIHKKDFALSESLIIAAQQLPSTSQQINSKQ